MNGIKKKRGPRQNVTDSEIISAIKKLGVDVFDNNKLKDKEDPVWQDIIKEVNGRITYLNLQLRLKRNIIYYFNNTHSNNYIKSEVNIKKTEKKKLKKCLLLKNYAS